MATARAVPTQLRQRHPGAYNRLKKPAQGPSWSHFKRLGTHLDWVDVVFAALSRSSRDGPKNRFSSCAVISRLNRGYAVLSIEFTVPPQAQTTADITTNDTGPNG